MPDSNVPGISCCARTPMQIRPDGKNIRMEKAGQRNSSGTPPLNRADGQIKPEAVYAMTDIEIIEHYGLTPHPEGGFYRRTYASSVRITYRDCERPVSTAILFLLKEGQYSRLHRIPQDEMWHFYLGGPLRLVLITPAGDAREILLGQDICAGQLMQYNVPGGSWFGATPARGSAYSLVGCTVSPGFRMEELQLGEAKDLHALFPSARHIIDEFCPPHSVQHQDTVCERFKTTMVSP